MCVCVCDRLAASTISSSQDDCSVSPACCRELSEMHVNNTWEGFTNSGGRQAYVMMCLAKPTLDPQTSINIYHV